MDFLLYFLVLVFIKSPARFLNSIKKEKFLKFKKWFLKVETQKIENKKITDFISVEDFLLN